MRWLNPALLALSLLALAAAPAHARRHHRAAAEAGSGGFDYYLFSLSVAPSFCGLSSRNQAKDECQALTRSAFRDTPLTVHGLWPNRVGVSVNQQPQDCPLPAPDLLPDPLPDATQRQLRRYMPGGPGLAQYEWRKHGACSGLSQPDYFAAVVRLAQQADASVGATMRERGMLGRRVAVTELVGAVADRDAALAQALVVSCRFPRGGGEAVIEEVRIVLSRDFRPLPAGQVGMGQNSGCPQGAGLVPLPGGQ